MLRATVLPGTTTSELARFDESRLAEARMRHGLASAAAAAVGGAPAAAAPVSASVELLHRGAHLHGRVLSGSSLAAGAEAWDVAAAILVGDYSLFAALEVLIATADQPLLERAAAVARRQAASALGQWQNELADVCDRDAYLAAVADTTSELLGLAGWGGARLGGGIPADADALRRYGHTIGFAARLADDLHELDGDDRAAGMRLGRQLSRGLLPLPIVVGTQRRPDLLDEAVAVRAEIVGGQAEAVWSERAAYIVSEIRPTGAPERVLSELRSLVQRANAILGALSSASDPTPLTVLSEGLADPPEFLR